MVKLIPIDDATLNVVDQAEKLLTALKATLGDKAIKSEDADTLAKAFADLRQRHSDHIYRKNIVQQIETLAKELPPADALQEAKRLHQESGKRVCPDSVKIP